MVISQLAQASVRFLDIVHSMKVSSASAEKAKKDVDSSRKIISAAVEGSYDADLLALHRIFETIVSRFMVVCSDKTGANDGG